jgi:hypothetical protein
VKIFSRDFLSLIIRQQQKIVESTGYYEANGKRTILNAIKIYSICCRSTVNRISKYGEVFEVSQLEDIIISK